MPYKSPDGDPMTYVYKIRFDKITGGNKGDIIDVEFSVDGDFFEKYLKVTKTVQGATDIVYLRMDKIEETDKFRYAIGEITITVKFTNSEPYVLNTKLYHTGFFHYMGDPVMGGSGSYAYANSSDVGYYYYEVVEMEGKHWLDRNVGAKSNKMLVNNGDGNTKTVGVNDASGLFYTIATPGDVSTTPETAVEYDYGMCPPGYTIPTSTEWSTLRMSSSFKSSQLTLDETAIYATYYETGNPEIGNIYFPKSRYYNSTQQSTVKYVDLSQVNTGDAGAGYYWSISEAEGLEKVQIGKFLKVLNLSGTSSSYINGSIEDSKMNIRCIADIPSEHSATEQKYSIEFNVKGATHVYLYTDNGDGTKSGVFSFPGKAIGSQSAVNNLIYNEENVGYDSSYIRFSYSSSYEASKLKVFFAYVTDDGQITVISENGKTSLEEATGWTVTNGYNYFFNWEDITDDQKRKWSVSKIGESGKDEADLSSYYYKTGNEVTVSWPASVKEGDTSYVMNYAYIFFPDGTKVNAGERADWPGTSFTPNEDGQCTLTFTVPQRKIKDENGDEIEVDLFADYFTVIFNGGQDTYQAPDIWVGNEQYMGEAVEEIKKVGNNITVKIKEGVLTKK